MKYILCAEYDYDETDYSCVEIEDSKVEGAVHIIELSPDFGEILSISDQKPFVSVHYIDFNKWAVKKMKSLKKELEDVTKEKERISKLKQSDLHAVYLEDKKSNENFMKSLFNSNATFALPLIMEENLTSSKASVTKEMKEKKKLMEMIQNI